MSSFVALTEAPKTRSARFPSSWRLRSQPGAHWPLRRGREQKLAYQSGLSQRPTPNAPGVQEVLDRAFGQHGISHAPLHEAQRRRHGVDLEHHVGDHTELLKLVVDEDA